MVSLVLICLTIFVIQSATTSSSPVQLSLSQEKHFFPHETSTYTQHASIEIKTGAHSGTQSTLPRELFIVLDSSGSMAGANKWGNAISAIEHIIKNMNADDRLHMVHYNSISSVVFENAHDQQAMLQALYALHPSGGTNLKAGFDQIMRLLQKYTDRSTVKRLFVLSDGQINEGVTDHQRLLGEVTAMKTTYDVTICSFGIGDDFDEKLMVNIADHGSGDYFFIKGAESMEKVVGIAYRGFQNLMGVDAHLKVTSKYGAKIVDVYGYEMTDKDEQIIPIGNLRYNDMMNVLLEMQVQVTDELLESSEIDYLIVELWMVDVADRQVKLVATETLQLSFSRDEKELSELNELVQYLVELQKVQRSEKKRTQSLRDGHADDAIELIRLQQRSIEVLQDYIAAMPISSADSNWDTYEFIQRKTSAMKRRVEDLEHLLTSGTASIKTISFLSSYSEQLNEKHSEAHDDL